ncbi:hypothetical protein WICPIJ_000669 [Wickerhamomyces pijperi]|uniref:RRM domain-containing protein n=1 Tax=Wickerhamomyces pijperi TaxID=599730 RepID=A0A9P8QDA2_WICPI|nr:hypothetical protein WICPIJ_000669 [Wickerhamomyces pijperi]
MQQHHTNGSNSSRKPSLPILHSSAYHSHNTSTEMIIPQSPFDIAYGSSLLPRQLLMGSPFVNTPVNQTPSSASIHTYSQLQSTPQHQQQHQQQHYYPQQPTYYFNGHQQYYYGVTPARHGSVASATEQFPGSLKLQMPGENSRFRRNKSKINAGNLSTKKKSNSKDKDSDQESEKVADLEPTETEMDRDTESVKDCTETDIDLELELLQSTPSKMPVSVSPTSTPTTATATATIFPSIKSYSTLSPTRTLVFENVNSELSISQFLDMIKFGPLESIRMIKPSGSLSSSPNNNIGSGSGCHSTVILTFLSKKTSESCFNSLLNYYSEFKKSVLSGDDLKIRFGETSSIAGGGGAMVLKEKIKVYGAVRCVYINGLIEHSDEAEAEAEAEDDELKRQIEAEVCKFGPVEKIEIIKNKESTVLVHFMSIVSAVKCVELLKLRPAPSVKATESQSQHQPALKWDQCEVFYGVDRCQQQEMELEEQQGDEDDDEPDQYQQQNQIEFQDHYNFDGNMDPDSFIAQPQDILQPQILYHQHQHQHQQPFSPSTPLRPSVIYYQQHQPIATDTDSVISNTTQSTNTTTATTNTNTNTNMTMAAQGTRSVCIGNLKPCSTAEDLCNIIRGGVLQSIKHFPDRHICFVTFISLQSAQEFFQRSITEGLKLHGKWLKIGWGRQTGKLPRDVELGVSVGASRNIYIGSIAPEEGEEGEARHSLPDLQQIREDFQRCYGEVEQVNYMKMLGASAGEKARACFVNFMNITNAIRVVRDYEQDEEAFLLRLGDGQGRYRGCKFAFGKDRCGNKPKGAGKLASRKKKRSRVRFGREQDQDQQPKNSHDLVPPVEQLSIGETIQEEDEDEEDDEEDYKSEKSDSSTSISSDFDLITCPPHRISSTASKPQNPTRRTAHNKSQLSEKRHFFTPTPPTSSDSQDHLRLKHLSRKSNPGFLSRKQSTTGSQVMQQYLTAQSQNHNNLLQQQHFQNPNLSQLGHILYTQQRTPQRSQSNYSRPQQNHRQRQKYNTGQLEERSE